MDSHSKQDEIDSYTQLRSEEIVDIARKFGIQDIAQHYPLKEGQTNSSYVLHTSQGVYVLTACDSEVLNTKADEKTSSGVQGLGIENLVALLRILEEHNFPTSRLVPSEEGNFIVKSPIRSIRDKYKGTRSIILKEYLEGQVLNNLTPGMLSQLGETIAQLHQIAPPGFLSIAYPYGIKAFPEVTELDVQHEYIEWLREKSKYLRESLCPNLPRGLVHGDMFPENIIFDCENIKAIIDFEESSNDFCIFDIGVAIIAACIERENVSVEKIRALVDGYQKIRPLEQEERNALKDFVEYAAVAVSFWRFRQYNVLKMRLARRRSYEEMVKIADNVHSLPQIKFMSAVF